MKKFVVFAFIMAVSAFSAVSCGNDSPSESSVTLDLPKVTTESSESGTESATEPATEANTSEKDTAVSAMSTELSTTVVAESVTEAVAEEVTDAPAVEVTPTPATEAPVTEAPATEPPATEAPVVEPPVVQQAQFSFGNLDSSALDVVASLGDALDIQNATGCLSNGADQRIYVYDGLKLSCYMNGDTPYIYEINITNGNYSTSSGITVGSSRASVEAAYGAGSASGDYVIYYDGNKELDIQYNGDTVASIVFYMAV